MSKTRYYTGVKALCPYYRGQKARAQVICCETWEDEMKSSFTFTTPAKWKQYLRTYCEDKYTECLRYKTITERLENEGVTD